MVFTYDDSALAPDTVSFSRLDGSHDTGKPHADSPTIWNGGCRGGRAIAEQARALSVGGGLAPCAGDFSASRDAVQHETRTGDVYQIGLCFQDALAWRGEDGCERTIESGQGRIHRVMPSFYESAFFRGQACRTVSVAGKPAPPCPRARRRWHRLVSATRAHRGDARAFRRAFPPARAPQGIRRGQALSRRQGDRGPGPLLRAGIRRKRLERRTAVSAEDWRAIAQAHAIIEREYARPLTIASLSRRVLLNECKPKAGFKACFGTTIHSFVRACRCGRPAVLSNARGAASKTPLGWWAKPT